MNDYLETTVSGVYAAGDVDRLMAALGALGRGFISETGWRCISMDRNVLLIQPGTVEYGIMQQRQLRLVEARLRGQVQDCVFCLEHPPVVTIGRAGGSENLLLEAEALAKLGIALYRTERGGNITYHGPGQVVIYPILNLRDYRRDLHWYVRLLEQAVRDTLAQFGIPSGTREGMTGVWVGDKKIAAIGVAVRSWVTYHGVALNVNNDLKPFEYIVPCGLKGYGVTSMREELGSRVLWQEASAVLTTVLAERLGVTFQFVKYEPAILCGWEGQ